MAKLTEEIIKDRLEIHCEWNYSGDFLFKEYICKDFSRALAFIVQIGIESEKMDHHPEILLHSWNRVKITLSTHSEGGVTEKDFELLTKIEKIKND